MTACKIFDGKDIKRMESPNFNYYFSKKNGFTVTWGKTLSDNPEVSDFGPMIADIEISTICSNRCSFCFVPGTLVSTPNGLRNIESLKVGEVCYSYDEKESKLIENVIDQVHERDYTGDIIELKIGDSIIKVTPNHTFYVTGKGWVEAKDLNPNDDIKEF